MKPGASASIQIEQPLEEQIGAGWLPLVIEIENKALADRRWRFDFNLQSFGRGPGRSGGGLYLSSIGRETIEVPAGTKKRVPLLLPLSWESYALRSSSISVMVEGPELLQPYVVLDLEGYYSANATGLTALSPQLAPENYSRLEAKFATETNPRDQLATEELIAVVLDPAQLPADWRSYALLENMWLSRQEWLNLSASHRAAILKWVFQGGRLYLAGVTTGIEGIPSFTDTRTIRESGFYTKSQVARHGLGKISTVPFITDEGTLAKPHEATTRLPAGWMYSEAMGGVDGPGLSVVSRSVPTNMAEASLGEIRVGGLGVSLLIAAIAILMGPVNLWFIAGRGHRSRLFFTVPAISLSGSGLLFLLVLLQDGTGGTGLRSALVLLNSASPEALVIQGQSARSGFLGSSEFPLSREVAMVGLSPSVSTGLQVNVNPYRLPKNGLDRIGEQASGNWFQNRSMDTHHLRTFISTRAAITLKNDTTSGVPAVLSTCPVVLQEFYMVDADGAAWLAKSLPPGQWVELEPVAKSSLVDWRTALLEQRLQLPGGMEAALKNIPWKEPMRFLALSEAWEDLAPIPTLDSIRWDDSVIVTGIVRKEGRENTTEEGASNE